MRPWRGLLAGILAGCSYDVCGYEHRDSSEPVPAGVCMRATAASGPAQLATSAAPCTDVAECVILLPGQAVHTFRRAGEPDVPSDVRREQATLDADGVCPLECP